MWNNSLWIQPLFYSFSNKTFWVLCFRCWTLIIQDPYTTFKESKEYQELLLAAILLTNKNNVLKYWPENYSCCTWDTCHLETNFPLALPQLFIASAGYSEHFSQVNLSQVLMYCRFKTMTIMIIILASVLYRLKWITLNHCPLTCSAIWSTILVLIQTEKIKSSLKSHFSQFQTVIPIAEVLIWSKSN